MAHTAGSARAAGSPAARCDGLPSVVCHDADALRAAEVDQRLLAEVRVALDLRRAVAHAFSYGPVCRLTLVTCDWPAQAVAS